MGNKANEARGIPSLDGLRAFSVFAVILGHSESESLKYVPFLRQGGTGVAVFFVLSGFLITHLLLKELNRNGKIQLGRFYFRRTLRIFPPFYAFLAVIAVLSAFGVVSVSKSEIAVAASYTWNYAWVKAGWLLGHTWSLSLEEQFYLLWPVCMTRFSKVTNLRIAIAIVLLSPFSRVITYYVWPSGRPHIDMMLHTHLDTIMMGCLLSLALDLKIWKRAFDYALKWWAPMVSLVFLLFIDAPAKEHLRGTYQFLIGFSLENLAISVILLYGVFKHHSFLGSLLNLGVIRHLGRISYSLYLWQQLFTGTYTRLFPLNIVAIVVAAELSFWLVERPSLKLRDYLEPLFFKRETRPLPDLQSAVD